jgi:hypothetical protein
MFISSSGNVGIGTSTPVRNLVVQGLTTSTLRIASPNGTSGETTRLEFNTNSDPGVWTSTITVFQGSGGAQQDFRFYPGGAASSLTLASSGNAGMGITTPSAKLHIRGSGATDSSTAFLIQNSTPVNIFTVRDNGLTTISGSFEQSGSFYSRGISGTDSGFLVKAPNNFDAIRVYDNGTVRLGSDGATTFGLEVYGNQGMAFRAGNGYINVPRNITPISSNTGGSVIFGLVNQIFAGVNDNYNFFDGDAPATSVYTWNGVKIMPTIITQNDSSANMLVINPTYNLANSYTSAGVMRGLYYNPTITTLRTATHRAIETTSGDILFQSGSSPLFFVSQSGNIGVGTSIPSASLHVRSTASITDVAFFQSNANGLCLSFNGSRIGFQTAPDGVMFSPFFGFTQGSNVQKIGRANV